MADTAETGLPGEPDHDLARMTFLEHLEELRKRLVIIVIALVVAFFLCWQFADQIFLLLQQPLAKFLPEGDRLVYTRLTEPFVLYMKVAFYAGIFVASPVILLQVWLFIAPGLYARERRYAVPFIVLATLFSSAAATSAGNSFCLRRAASSSRPESSSSR